MGEKLRFGILVEALEEEYQKNLWNILNSYAQKDNYIFTSFIGTFRHHQFRQDIHYEVSTEFIKQMGLDGILIIGGSLNQYISQTLLEKFLVKLKPIPMVSIGHTIDNIISVNIDNAKGIAEAVRHLVEVHQIHDIAFIKGPENNRDADLRLKSFITAMDENSLSVSPDLLVSGHFSIESGRKAAKLLLEGENKCHGVICADDLTAIGFILESRRLGKAVPKDIVVVGFDDIDDSETFIPPLTTISQPLLDQVDSAIKLLLQLINKETSVKSVSVEPELIIRESCGCSHNNIAADKDRSTHFSGELDRRVREALETGIDSELIGWLQWHVRRFLNQSGKIERMNNQIQEEFNSIKETVGMKERVWLDNVYAKILCDQKKKNLENFDYNFSIKFDVSVKLEELKVLLLNTKSQAALINLLYTYLPGLHINSCFAVLYNHAERSFLPGKWDFPKESSLILAYSREGRLSGQSGMIFPTKDLLPEQFIMQFMEKSYIFMHLSFSSDYYGYALLEYSHESLPEMYESIRLHICSTLRGIFLIEELEKSLEQKTNFFVNVTHELKTPLTIMEGYLGKYIQENRESEDLAIISENLKKLRRDMNNILDMEKLEKGLPFCTYEQVINLSDYLHKAMDAIAPMLLKQNINFRESISGNLCIKIDENALYCLVYNLLDNAIKYNMTDGLLEIRLFEVDDNVEFDISNSGKRIPPDQKENIFNPYFQISREKSAHQGIGMGLSLVYNIVKALDGKIEVSDWAQEGTTFKVTFPKAEKKSDCAEPKEINLINQPIPSFPDDEIVIIEGRDTVLVIEDNLQMLVFLQQAVSTEFNCLWASNGEQALQRLEQGLELNLIISDIMMDNMDGYEFYRRIQVLAKYKNIPFIFLSAKSAQEERIKALEMGAVDFICKPFVIEELIAKIKSVTAKNRENKKTLQKNLQNRMNYYFQQKIGIGNDKPDSGSISKQILSQDLLEHYAISEKQKEIIEALLSGASYKETAEHAQISINTVRSHVKCIYSKCGINNKAELICIFNGK